MAKEPTGPPPVATNRRARRIYQIEDRIEAGIVLRGTEVKSVRSHKVSLADAYAVVEDDEVFLVGCHIAIYDKASWTNHDPRRRRKLLLHRHEIRKLKIKLLERGYTLVALAIYFRGPHAKVELGLARGKRQFDRREEIKRRDMERDIERSRRQR
jgi:SsrA-binding protein